MARSRGRKKPLQKVIKPTYYVFCEGETEKEYISFLKRLYHVPIEIKSKVEGNKISERTIVSFLKGKQTLDKDKIFLLYDIDVPGMLDRLEAIKNANLLVSNPCIELWFLLHLKDQKASITSSNCIKELNSLWLDYKKGYLTHKIKGDLSQNLHIAMGRAETLSKNLNPSSSIYELIKDLEELKSNSTLQV